jgi:hypothetical protein
MEQEIDKKIYLYSIYLERLNKFAYVRSRNMTNFQGITYLCIDVLDILTDEVNPNNLDSLKNVNPITSTIIMFDYIRNKGKSKWVLVGQDFPKDYELYFPQFRECNNQNIYSNTYNDSSGNWMVVQDSYIKEYPPYEELKHLGYHWGYSLKFTLHYITMIWLIRQGKLISDYYKEEEFKKDYFLTQLKIQAEHLVFFDNLPKDKWNRI